MATSYTTVLFITFVHIGRIRSKDDATRSWSVLGISPSASKLKIRRRTNGLLLLNHPDRSGSPYWTKINEARTYLKAAANREL